MNLRSLFAAMGLGLTFAVVVTQAQSADVSAGPPPVSALTMMASGIPSSDLDRSIAFYTKGMGMTLGGRMEMGAVTEVPLMFAGGGAYLILLKSRSNEQPLPVRSALSRVILAVPDLKALEAQLVASGYHLKAPIVEMPKYHVAVAQLEDPDGNHIELVQRSP